MVKRFLQQRGGGAGQGSRHAPATETDAPRFEIRNRKAIGPDAQELAENPRARSAKLRVAVRTDAPAGPVDRTKLGMPTLPTKGARH